MGIIRTVPETIRSAFVGDCHFGAEDPVALALVLEFLRYYKPHKLYILGDYVDFKILSRYRKDPITTVRLMDEITPAIDWLAAVRKALPRAEIHYLEGNHCLRIKTYLIDRAPELVDLPHLTFQQLLQFDKFKIIWHDEREVVKLNGLLIEHGHRGPLRRRSGASAAAMLDARGVCGISGHTHRLGTSYRRLSTLQDPDLVWVENGCTCDLNPDYAHVTDWQQGFHVGAHRKSGSKFHLTQIPIVKHTVFYNGSLWEVGKSRV